METKRHILPRFAMAAAVSAVALTLASCHKTCTCIGYDGSERSYTADEVDDRGVNCTEMVYQAGLQYYSVCNWE